MYSISQLAKKFGLSRSTLLYYDSIHLLKPASRSNSGYRQYSEDDRKLLKKICHYRGMGIPLDEIKQINQLTEHKVAGILEKQLQKLTEKIQELKQQQFAILEIIRNETTQKKFGIIDKKDWVSLLEASGMSDDDMNNWHKEFERLSSAAHYDFLISIGIGDHEARQIQENSR